MTSVSFTRLASVTASTKRADVTNNGTLTTQIATLACTPLDPGTQIQTADQALAGGVVVRGGIHQLLHTYAEGALDIVVGDVLVVDGVTYPIRDVDTWTFHGMPFLHLTVEDLTRYG